MLRTALAVLAVLACSLAAAGTAHAGTDTITRVAPDAGLQLPEGAAVAADGSYLIADKHSNRILRIRPDGQTAVAAGGGSDRNGEGVSALSAFVDYPTDVAVTADGGFLYVENNSNRVRKVNASGIVRTVAGTGSLATDGDGGPATAAGLYYPWSVAAMPDGGFVVSQPYSYRVRRVMPDGTIRTILGDGFDHYPDNVPGTHSGSKWPYGLAVQKDGSVLVAEDFGARVRRVRPDGVVVPFAGSGTDMGSGISGGSEDGKPATQVGLGRLCDVAVAPDDSVVIAQGDCAVGPYASNTRYYLLGRVTPDGKYSVFAGNGYGPTYDVEGRHRRQTSMSRVRGLAFTAGGDLLYVENSYYRAYRIDTDLVPPPKDPEDPKEDPEDPKDPQDPDGPGEQQPGGGPGTPPGGGDIGLPLPAGDDRPATGGEPLDDPAPVELLSRRLRARPGKPVNVVVRTPRAAEIGVELRKGSRRVRRVSRRVPSGRTTIKVAAPRKPGRYAVRVTAPGLSRTLTLTVAR